MANKPTGIMDPNIRQIYELVLGQGFNIMALWDPYWDVGKVFKLSKSGEMDWQVWLLPSDRWK